MMSRKIIGLISVLMLMLGVLTNTNNAKADVGEAPTPGGAITPGDKNDQIQMKSEDVVFTVKQGPAPSIFPDTNLQYYAHVKASFVMRNTTGQPVGKDLFFPFHTGSQFKEEMFADMQQARNAKATVNGQDVGLQYRSNIFKNKNIDVEAGLFNVNFAANADTNIVVEYDLRAVQEPKSYDVAFSYMMLTGSHWKDNIGSGKVTFDFPQDINSLTPFAKINSFFKVKDGNLVWEFNNLEPTADNDIEIAFDPRALDIWGKRPAFIDSIDASQPQSRIFVSDGTRSGDELPGGIARASKVNVLDYQAVDGGWLIEQKNPNFDEWLQFNLDGEYTFDSIQIRTGYQLSDFDNDTGLSRIYYDTFRRPKTVTVTYSTGKTQTVALQNISDEYQTIKLPEGATNSVKLTFSDAYDGVGNGVNMLGVGRVKFAGAKKVAQSSANQSNDSQPASQSQPANWLQQYWPYIAAAGGVVLIVTSLVVLKTVRLRKLKISKAETGNSDLLGAVDIKPANNKGAKAKDIKK